MSRKLTIASVVVATLSLAACYSNPHQCDCPEPGSAPDSTKPRVSIIEGQYLVVNQEPLVFTPRQRDVQIVWQLPAATGYRFTEDGIAFDDARDPKRTTRSSKGTADEEIVRCKRSDDGLTFSCLNRHTKPGDYKYSITIESKDGRKLTLDPRVINY